MTRIALVASLSFVIACSSRAPAATPVAPTSAAAAAPAAHGAAPANTEDSRIVIGMRKAMKSAILGEERKYWVHLPRGYEGGDRSYPVVVLLDGDGHLHHVSGITSFLQAQNRMPGVIIVGVLNTDRTRDLTPSRLARRPSSGGSDRFLQFIEKELLPKIEADYRTVPYKILIGHSFGGLFAVNAMLTRPGLFNAHIAASPSLEWDNELTAKRAAPILKSGALSAGFLYYTLGGEPEAITAGNKNFAALLKRSAAKGLTWKFDHMTAEDHGSVVHRTVYNGLEMLFAEWRIPTDTIKTVAELRARFAERQKKFAVDSKLPEGAINLLGYRQLQSKPPNFAAAKEFFELNIELHPNSANVYDSLGEMYETQGDVAKALANYEKAVARSKPGQPFHDAFIVNRDRAKAALAKGGAR